MDDPGPESFGDQADLPRILETKQKAAIAFHKANQDLALRGAAGAAGAAAVAQSSCCTPIMSRHALVGTPPGSLPCDCFSFPLATNMATGGGLSYPLGPGCCM